MISEECQVVEKIQGKWRIIGWRSMCFFAALILHAWAFSTPLPKRAISTSANDHQTPSVSLSFVMPAVETKPQGEAKVAEARLTKTNPEKIRLAKEKSVVADPTETNLSEKISTKTSSKKVNIDSTKAKLLSNNSVDVQREDSHLEALKNTKPMAAVSSTYKTASNHGIHNVPVVTEPLFNSPPIPPKYPTIARKRGQQGTVWLEIWLDKWGKQSKLSVIQSSGIRILDKAAEAAVASWQFQPYKVNGAGEASRVRIPVEFALN